MAILLKNNMLFLHIPKTGGNWVTEILKINGLIDKKLIGKHDTLELLNKRYSKIKYRKIFTFIRNPISWYESWFQYSTANNWRDWGVLSSYAKKYSLKWHPCKKLDGLGDKLFNKFIENVIENCPSYLSEMYELYTKNCDFIGRQENLQDDLIKTLNLNFQAGIRKKLKLIGKIGESKKLNIQWDADLKNKIIELEKDVFDKYYV